MSFEYRFGDFVVDLRGRSLRRGEREIHLGERAFDVLRLLLENAGSVVSRNELIDTVWREVIVTDDSLARAVSDLRTALSDDAAHARYIRTVHRRGYVLIAPVTAIDDSEPTPAVEPRRAVRWPHYALGAIGLTVGILALVLAVRGAAQNFADGTGSLQSEIAGWRLRALGPHPFAATAIKPAFARSNNLLSVVAPDPDTGEHSIFLLRPDGGEPLQLTRGLEVRGPSPEFTADDSHLLFTVYRSVSERGLVPDVWLAPVPAGEPTLLVKNASAASTGPDGRDLVYAAVTARGTSLRVRLEDGTDREIAAVGFWPRWSPDGRWIAYTTSDPEGGDGTIHVVRPDGSGHRRLTEISAQVYGLCWTPDSSHVIFANAERGPTTLWAVEVATGNRFAVTRGPGVSDSPAMAADGRRLVFHFSHRRWYLFLADAPGGSARRVLVEPGVLAAALSPDGNRVALAVGTAGQSSALSVLDLATQERRTLSGMTASSVAWMPDGRELLIAAPAPDGVSNWIWRLAVDGGLPRPVLKGNQSWEEPWPSPDGGTIAVVRLLPTGHELVLHELDTGNQRSLAVKAEIETPRWSPDGRLLAWSGARRPDDVGSGGVWVGPAKGGTPRRLTADGAWPVWEKDGEHLLYARFLEHEGIWRVPLDGGPPRLVRRLGDEMEDLYLEGLDTGASGTPLLFFLTKFTGELYALEPPPG
jgi:DNA-binding winged helix-turn-helix (wHTH) protein/Tol biopolymer transport system component